MVELVNALTGSQMWVDESRIDEYLAAGHHRPVVEAAPAVKEEAPAKPAAKKTTRKK